MRIAIVVGLSVAIILILLLLGVYLHHEQSESLESSTDVSMNFQVSVFQKIEDGLLRIATTIEDDYGSRITNTFIPNESVVVGTILQGYDYYGRVIVLGEWFFVCIQVYL